jgi:putative restriction endonuclease
MVGTDMIIDKFISDINAMKLNIQNGRPALKKPLLLLLVISKFEEGYFNENKIRYTDLENELVELIENYGGRSTSSGPKAYQPYQYLESSPFWNIHLPNGVNMTHKKDLNLKIIRDKDTFVALEYDLYLTLKDSKEARATVAQFILQKWWPETVQEDLRKILDLPILNQVIMKRNRNKDFTNLVLANFRYKCAVCGFSSIFNKSTFGIDGSHIRWFSQNGPDTVDNGLSLCKFHHWAFDRGVISINPKSFEILVSGKFIGQEEQSINIIETLKGKSILPYKDIRPNPIYLEWHNDFIFVG